MTVDTGELVQERVATTDSGQGSARGPSVHVGLGDAEYADVVVWLPDGRRIEGFDVQARQRLVFVD